MESPPSADPQAQPLPRQSRTRTAPPAAPPGPSFFQEPGETLTPSPIPDISSLPRYGDDDSGNDSPLSENPDKAASTSGAPLGVKETKLLVEAIAQAAQLVGEGLHWGFANHPNEEASDLWRIEEDDAIKIAKPTARIILRRSPKFTADAIDALTGLIVFAAYVVDQLKLKVTLRRQRLAGWVPPLTPESETD